MEGPDEPRLGGALITWVEPAPEHVVGYNRWYEDDHMITGAMVMPWMFSCRRWVAPRWIQHLRAPTGSRVADPLDRGKYIGVYWVNEGRVAEHESWAIAANIRLHEEGRGSYRGHGADPLEERQHVFTAFCDYLGATYRDDDVPRAVHTLVQPYQGLVVELLDAPKPEARAELHKWIADDDLPERVDGPVAVALRFDPRPRTPSTLTHVRELECPDRIAVVLHFLECDPRDCWDERFADAAVRIAEGGKGTLAVQAAFIPTRHGTNVYTDELF